MTEAEARREILEKVREYYHCFHDGKRWDGKHVSYGGRVYNEREMENLTEAMLDFGLTAGRFAMAFERNFAAYIGVKHCALVNSGSSANPVSYTHLDVYKRQDKAPGIYSARFLGEDTPYPEKFKVILEKLKDVEEKDRKMCIRDRNCSALMMRSLINSLKSERISITKCLVHRKIC